MPRYSARSRGHLETCHKDLQRLFNEVIKVYDCSILEGHRSLERQHQLVEARKSKVKLSKHNYRPSLAVDVAPYPIDWQDTDRFVHFGLYVLDVAKEMSVEIRWGGDWDGDGDRTDQTFDDLVHFELRTR